VQLPACARFLRGLGAVLGSQYASWRGKALQTSDSPLSPAFIYQDAAAEPRAWRITNWEHTDSGALTEEFQIISHTPSTPDNLLLISAGNTSAVEGSDTEMLEALLRRGIPHLTEQFVSQQVTDLKSPTFFLCGPRVYR
jgi:hypothetical protein